MQFVLLRIKRSSGGMLGNGGVFMKKKPGKPEIVTDPQGSYTGRPENREEVPVQDADDL